MRFSGYLYYPPTAVCYHPFEQGPCAHNAVIVLASGSNIPQCQINTCNVGYISFRRACYQLHKPGPCKFPELAYVVGVNVTTLRLDCVPEEATSGVVPKPLIVDVELVDRFGGEDDIVTTTVRSVDTNTYEPCPVGSKRWLEKTCNQ